MTDVLYIAIGGDYNGELNIVEPYTENQSELYLFPPIKTNVIPHNDTNPSLGTETNRWNGLFLNQLTLDSNNITSTNNIVNLFTNNTIDLINIGNSESVVKIDGTLVFDNTNIVNSEILDYGYITDTPVYFKDYGYVTNIIPKNTYTYISENSSLSHTIEHNLNSEFLLCDVLVLRAGVYKNELVDITYLDANTLIIDSEELINIKVIIKTID